jgi:hypothetical protein
VGDEAKINSNLLPWAEIASRYGANSSFCEISNDIEVSGQSASYAFQLSQSLMVKCPNNELVDCAIDEFRFEVARYNEGKWQDVRNSKFIVKTNSNRIDIANVTGEEGFYKVNIWPKNQGDRGLGVEIYAIYTNRWKKELFAYCRKSKEEIEKNADTELYRSCIVVSHFDHLMEIVSRNEALTEEILIALADVEQSKKDFKSGKCPDLVIGGLNKIRLRRFAGSPIAEFVVFVPEDHEEGESIPLYLHPDARRIYTKGNYARRSGFLDLWWHFPYPAPDVFEWKDYVYLKEILKEKIRFDEDRIYIKGNCGNGIAAMNMVLRHPDEWAEFNWSMGNSYRYLAGNALNIPLIFVKGPHDDENRVAYYDLAVNCFEYYGCRYFKSSNLLSEAKVRGKLLPDAIRGREPGTIQLSIDTLEDNKAYWLKIDGRIDENNTGRIDASVSGQTIKIETDNVDAYTVDIAGAPLDSNKSVEIVENGQSLGGMVDSSFKRRSPKYTDARYIKNSLMSGPISDVFTEAYIVVYGTGGDDVDFNDTSRKIGLGVANGAPCLADVELSSDMIKSHNLVLIGSKQSNRWFSQISEELPLDINSNSVIANAQTFTGSGFGYMLIYPNPLNPEKYVAVFSATSTEAMSSTIDAYKELLDRNPADIGIYKITKAGIEWLIMEKFNTVWQWHKAYDEVVCTIEKKHLQWQWEQWVGRVIRSQMEADVAIYGDSFKFPNHIATGKRTYRDLFNTFENLWILKVKITGKALRKFLSMPFGYGDKKMKPLHVNGAGLIDLPHNKQEKIITLKDIDNDEFYTLAIPEKCMDNDRVGIIMKEYEIIGDSYLLPMLAGYLTQGVDVDKELDSYKYERF